MTKHSTCLCLLCFFSTSTVFQNVSLRLSMLQCFNAGVLLQCVSGSCLDFVLFWSDVPEKP